MWGRKALEVCGGKVLGKGFEAGDPDDSAMLWGRADEERSQKVREEVVTEDVGAEDFAERGMRGCLGVVGYWIDGLMIIAGIKLLGGCSGAHAPDFESRVGTSLHRTGHHTPYGIRPVDAGEAASSGVEDDRVEFGHIV